MVWQGYKQGKSGGAAADYQKDISKGAPAIAKLKQVLSSHKFYHDYRAEARKRMGSTVSAYDLQAMTGTRQFEPALP